MRPEMIFIIFLFFLLLKISFKSKNKYSIKKGKKGESEIINKLKKLNGKILSNLYFFQNNYSTEVDIVYINESGIFVIESKNYQGDVYGNWNDVKWKHVVNEKEWELLNPVNQNNVHINEIRKAIKKVVNVEIPIWSIIIFSNETNLNVQPRRDDNIIICKQEGINQMFNYCKMISNVNMSNKDIHIFYKILKPYTKVSKRKKRKHIKYVTAKAA